MRAMTHQPLRHQPLRQPQHHTACNTCATARAHGWSGQCDPQREAIRDTQHTTCTQHKRAALRQVWGGTIIAIALSFIAIAIAYGITHAYMVHERTIYAVMYYSGRAMLHELGFISLVCAAAAIHELCMRASDAVFDRIHTRIK